ncbi:MAG: sigma-70 family RNA polymerase sigma factor [Pseudomonadota bacterium]
MQTGHRDEQAFRQLYTLTSAQLFKAALRSVWIRETAEEVLQESFIAIWRDAASFDCGRAAPLTWMTAIVRNKSVDWLRANHARNFYTVAWDGAEHDQPCNAESDPCASAEREQRRQQIDSGMTHLDALHRQAIELCFFKELSHSQVATEMTIPLGTVKTWIRRGCQQIRHHMEHHAA